MWRVKSRKRKEIVDKDNREEETSVTGEGRDTRRDARWKRKARRHDGRVGMVNIVSTAKVLYGMSMIIPAFPGKQTSCPLSGITG